MTVKQYGADAALGLADRIWPCYREAFGDFDDFGAWYTDMFARHAARDGYRLVAAGADGPAVTGFAWGYVGQRGQCWTDLVASALLPGVGRQCLLSTTDDPADPAVQLYLGRGWRKLGLLRLGVQVMGRGLASGYGS